VDAATAASGASPWRSQGEIAKPMSPRSRRGVYIVLAFATLFVLCAVLVWVALWLRPGKDTALVLIGAGYEDNLAVPHNVYGRRGLEEMAALSRTEPASFGGGRLRMGAQRQFTDVTDWDKDLARIKQKTIFLFFAAHGGVDSRGAYLLPQRALLPSAADPQEPDGRRLYLTKILERLKRVKQHHNIILVLDATQITAHWPLGMLHNDFAAELEKLNDQIAALPNLIVISASGVDQRSWTSPELRKTIFTHYLIEGLKGHADGNDDGHVSALELYDYASEKVETWVRNNRGAAQAPVLLPAGVTGRDRAHAMHLTVADYPRSAAPEKNPVYTPSKELERAWQRFADLENRRPAPAVHAPELWARYQQTLLRYEELAQLDDTSTLKRLANQLNDLEQKIVQSETLPLSSVQNTLAMPVVGGAVLPADDVPLKAVEALRKAPEKERAKVWTTELAKAGGEGLARQLFRLRVCELLLERLKEAPTRALDTVAELLKTIDDPLNPRPAEAHFTVMLRGGLYRKDNEVSLPAELVRLALQVRIRAERAALGLASDAAPGRDLRRQAESGLYVEQVQPWLRQAVAAADADRRLGEDRLFSSETPDWTEARGYLEKADGLYKQAQARAAQVRAALATRDRALARLPALTHWAARRAAQAESEAELKAAEQLLGQAERACLAAHHLVSVLEQRAGAGDAELLKLRDAAAAAQAGVEELEAAYQRALEGADRLPPPQAWRAYDDLLTVPGGPAKDRIDLLVKKSTTGYKMLNERPATEPAALSQSAQEKAARRAAEAEGRMALALYGARIFQEIDAKKSDGKELERLPVLHLDPKWRPLAAAIGEQVGARSLGLPREVNLRLARAGKLGSAKALAELQTAERLARQLDAGGSLLTPKSAVREHRKALVQELLLSQGERALLDHWYAEDPGKEPYFRAAGGSYLRDVGKHDGVAGLKKRLAQDRTLQIVLDYAPSLPPKEAGEPTLHFTSEDTFPVRYRLTLVGATPAPIGVPVVWVKPGDELTVSQPAQGRRQLLPLSAGVLATTLTSKLLAESEAKPPPRPSAVESSLTVHGLYRGQKLDRTTPVQLHPLAQTIVTTHPTPAMASVAVRSPKEIQEQHGASKGAVAIVLDCSGSMGPLRGQPKESSKFAEAAASVRALLQRIPRGTRVSLWVFGQATGASKTATKAEDTIEMMLAPSTWNPDDAEAIDALMTRVQALEPWNESPIARTMYRAAREHLDQATGYKTMIVITDGMDNRFEQDAQLNPDKKGVAAFLMENFRDIEVNVIGFKLVSQEEKAARAQFEVVTKLPQKGQFFLVGEARDLVVKMEKLLPSKLTYDLLVDDNRPQPALVKEGLTISRDGGNDRWYREGLWPGPYLLYVAAKNPAQQSILLDRGDLLLLEVEPNKAGLLHFRRLLYSEADYPWKLAKEKAGWRLAVLQNQRVAPAGLQMLLTLEKQDLTQAATLRQWTPAKTWFEVTPPPEVKTPVSRRWHYQPGYPAAAWSVESPEWPSAGATPARPLVRAWWSPDASALVGETLERGKDFTSLKDVLDRPLTVDREKVFVESVQLERHLVELKPGVGDAASQREDQMCLVVRVSHPLGHPVWAELRGLETKGAEHRYYTNAGKYTAIFWPVTPDQADKALKGLAVYSLPAFKSDAEKRGFAVDVPNLYEPQASDTRPLPPLLLPAGKLTVAPTPLPKGQPFPPPPRLFTEPVLTPQGVPAISSRS
jgi:hypothetical protein